MIFKFFLASKIDESYLTWSWNNIRGVSRQHTVKNAEKYLELDERYLITKIRGEAKRSDSEVRRSEARRSQILKIRTRRGEARWKVVEAKRSDSAKTCLVSGSDCQFHATISNCVWSWPQADCQGINQFRCVINYFYCWALKNFFDSD